MTADKHFEAAADILQLIYEKIDSTTDTAWTSFDSPEALKQDIEKSIEKLRRCDSGALELVRWQFLATGTFQELAFSNGWSDEYLQIAAAFDRAYELSKAAR